MSDESKNRSNLQIRLDQAWDKFRDELHKKRLNYARLGFTKFRQHRITEAIREYETYIRILEEYKRVSQGQLTPELFDIKTEAQELLILSAVYWDLVKAYDRTKSIEKRKDFLNYLEKYYLFVKDLPHMGLGTDTIRQYIYTNHASHKEDFIRIYKKLDTSKCFITGALPDHLDRDTLIILRIYRDSLKNSWSGSALVFAYEKVSPYISSRLVKSPNFLRKIVAVFIIYFSKIILK